MRTTKNMKKALFLVVMSLCVFAAFCQDIIVMRNGDEIEAIIQDIGVSEVKYKRSNNSAGPTYTVLKSDISMIRYANGEEETFSDAKASASLVGDFTTSQRFGTWAINSLVPELGSFILMKDTKGGLIQLGAGVLGMGLTIGGAVKIVEANTYTRTYHWWTGWVGGPDEAEAKTGTTMVVIGGILWVGVGIFNIARSVTYNPPAPKVAGGFDPTALQVAVVPGNHGIEKVSLHYTSRF